MASNDSKTQVQRRGVVLGQLSPIDLPPFPEIPASMVKRFPELAAFNEATQRWLQNANHALAKLSAPKQQE